MSPRILAPLLATLVACGPSEPSKLCWEPFYPCAEGEGAEAGELAASSAPLEFKKAYVGGGRSQRLLTVENPSTVEVLARVELTGDAFEVEAPSFALPAGESKIVRLTFRPSQTGRHEGRAVLFGGSAPIQVALSGVGLAALECAPSTTCRTFRFSPEKGRCISEDAPSDTPCEEICLGRATCSRGTCVGPPKNCGDEDPSTMDSCSPVLGCVHAEVSPGPCEQRRCDPDGGCVLEPVADGTSCGAPQLCERSRSCVAGQCVVANEPDGAACQTPCGSGMCGGGTCDAGVAEPDLRWRYVTDAGLVSALLGDEEENVYFSECSADASCDVVSLDRDGRERFRAESALIPSMLDGDGLLALGGDTLERRSRTDGAVVWRVPLAPHRPSCEGEQLSRLETVRSDGTAVVTYSAACKAGPPESVVIGVARDGGLAFVLHRAALLDGINAGADNALFLTRRTGDGGAVVERMNEDATPHWETRVESRPVVVGDTLFTSGALLSSETGAPLSYVALRSPRGALHEPIGHDGRVLSPIDEPDDAWEFRHQLYFAQLSPRQLLREIEVPVRVSADRLRVTGGQTLTEDDGALLVHSSTLKSGWTEDLSTETRVHLLDRDGDSVFSCKLDNVPVFGRPVLQRDQVVSAHQGVHVLAYRGPEISFHEVRAYALPGVRPAKTGWITEGGNPQRNGRPVEVK